MKVINCTHLAYFRPISYEYTRAVQLQKPEVYPPLLPLLSTYTHLQMCSYVYLQMPCIDRTISTQQIHDTQVFSNLKTLCCTCIAVYFYGATEVPFPSPTGFTPVKAEMGFLPTCISVCADAEAGGFATQNSLK